MGTVAHIDAQETDNAEGGTRTPMPVKAQRPERCVSTDFTTSACLVFCGHAQYYCITCELSRAYSGFWIAGPLGEMGKTLFQQACSRVGRAHDATNVDISRGDVTVPQETLK